MSARSRRWCPRLDWRRRPGTSQVLWTLAVFAIVRLIQTNFVTPFVTARVVAIPPAMTVFAIIGIGYVFGIFGLFFSGALLTVIYSLTRSLYLREVLGEDIPRARHRTLLGPDHDIAGGEPERPADDPTPRDSR